MGPQVKSCVPHLNKWASLSDEIEFIGVPCLIAPWSTEGHSYSKGTWKIELVLAFLNIASTHMSVGFLGLVELTPLNTNWKATPFIPAPSPESDCRAIRTLLQIVFLKLVLEIRCGDCTQEQPCNLQVAQTQYCSSTNGGLQVRCVHLSEVSTCTGFSLSWALLKGLNSVLLFSKCSIQQ